MYWVRSEQMCIINSKLCHTGSLMFPTNLYSEHLFTCIKCFQLLLFQLSPSSIGFNNGISPSLELILSIVASYSPIYLLLQAERVEHQQLYINYPCELFIPRTIYLCDKNWKNISYISFFSTMCVCVCVLCVGVSVSRFGRS